MTISEKIKSLRLSKGISADEVAEKIGVSRATYYRIESKDVNNMPIDLIPDLAKALGTTAGYLLTDVLDENEHKNQDCITIPVYGRVAAGIPIEAIEERITDICFHNPRPGQNYIALQVNGDSMYPKYIDGDYVIIRLQADCETGSDAVVFIDGQDATLKKIIKKDDGTIILQPLNHAYDPIIFTRNSSNKDSLTVLGTVIEMRRITEN